MNCTYTHDVYKYYQMNAVKLANQNNSRTSPFTIKFQRILNTLEQNMHGDHETEAEGFHKEIL